MHACMYGAFRKRYACTKCATNFMRKNGRKRAKTENRHTIQKKKKIKSVIQEKMQNYPNKVITKIN